MPNFAIPKTVAVMKLNQFTLFPHGVIPLRIWEPRYVEMLQHAMEGDCFFSLCCLQSKSEAATVEPCDIGTLVLLRASHASNDGTYNILVHGMIRVRFLEWHLDAAYPRASIEPLHSLAVPDNQCKAAVRTLRGCVEDAIDDLPAEMQKAISELLHDTDDPAALADIVSQHFIHDPSERQKLLEELSAATRISRLCQAIQRD